MCEELKVLARIIRPTYLIRKEQCIARFLNDSVVDFKGYAL
jgi:hypothetical protein